MGWSRPTSRASALSRRWAGTSSRPSSTPGSSSVVGRAQQVWTEVLDRASEHIDVSSLRVWFEGIRPVDLYEDQLEISVPNTFAKEYIESRFRPLLEEVLDEVVGQETHLVVSVAAPGEHAGNGAAAEAAESVLNARAPRSFRAKYTFDTFVIGAGNR